MYISRFFFLILTFATISGCAVNGLPKKKLDLKLPEVDARSEVKGKITERRTPLRAAEDVNDNASTNKILLKLDNLISLRMPSAPGFRGDGDPAAAGSSDKASTEKSGRNLISIQMHDGRLDQLFWELSKKLNLNLIIEPEVLKSDTKVSMNLSGVSSAEVLARIMDIFDLYPVISDSSLVVREYEDRLFNLDILNARTNITVNSGGDALGGSSSNKGSVSVSMEGGDKTDQFDQIVKQIELLLQDSADSANKSAPTAKRETRLAVNKASGTVLVRAKPSKVRMIAEFIGNTKKMLMKQVQIDVQLVDVQLNDEFNLGIDWGLLSNNIAAVAGSMSAVVGSQSATFPSRSGLAARAITFPQQIIGNPGSAAGGGLMINTGRGGVILNALSQFGNIKVVSNPSLRIKNGVPAYISVGTNYRIVSKVTTTSSPSTAGNAQTSTDVQTDTIFSGIVLAVTALIKEDDSIELFVHPSQSRAREDRLALIPVSANASVTLPVIEQKSLSTTLKLASDDVVILGGLLDQQASASNSGIPGLSELEGIGAWFGRKQSTKAARELVVVLRAKLL